MSYLNSNKILEVEKSYNQRIFFNKKELGIIFNIYGKMVSKGEWRDYGISVNKNTSIFSIYRHTSEFPLYKIKKNSADKKNIIFSLVTMNGRILKRGNDLSLVLKPLNLQLIELVK